MLYDYLVNPQVLVHMRAERPSWSAWGGMARGRIMSQQEVNERMIAAARAGRNVVRLKAGRSAGLRSRHRRMCSALVAAGSRLRDRAGRHDGPGRGGLRRRAAHGATSWRRPWRWSLGMKKTTRTRQSTTPSLAKFPGTLVFYMGVTTVDHWTAALTARRASAPIRPSPCPALHLARPVDVSHDARQRQRENSTSASSTAGDHDRGRRGRRRAAGRMVHGPARCLASGSSSPVRANKPTTCVRG